MEEYIKPELSSIFWVKIVAKNIVLGSPGTHFMDMRVNDPYARVCDPDNVININVKVFNLMLGVNATKFLVQRKSCKFKYGLIEKVM